MHLSILLVVYQQFYVKSNQIVKTSQHSLHTRYGCLYMFPLIANIIAFRSGYLSLSHFFSFSQCFYAIEIDIDLNFEIINVFSNMLM